MTVTIGKLGETSGLAPVFDVREDYRQKSAGWDLFKVLAKRMNYMPHSQARDRLIGDTKPNFNALFTFHSDIITRDDFSLCLTHFNLFIIANIWLVKLCQTKH